MMTRDPSLEEMAAVLEKARIRGGELRACCPAHSGEDPNLSLRYENGKLLATCHSRSCPFPEIMAAIRERLGGTPGERVDVRVGGGTPRKTRPEPRKTRPEKGLASGGRKVWELRDERGDLVAYHVREDKPNGKVVRWKLPDETWGLGGRSTSDLPLYGVREALKTSPETPIVVTEGEKAADALRDAGIAAVGTVTGASGTPGERALAPFRGRSVILWPDNDSPGHEHMGRVAKSLVEAGADVRWFEWDGPDKGDAADHPATQGGDAAALVAALEAAPRWSKAPALEGRALLGAAIRHGIEPPEELLSDILLAGKAHNLYAPGGIGKTWILIWIATELSKRGKRVAIFDLENGLRTYAERFEEMGADLSRLDENILYYPFPTLDRASYERFLEEEEPDLVMFDSWIGFLAADGRDENVSNDISMWADAYSKPALRRGTAILLLDHVPHDHERERGSSRKRDEMDVVWKVSALGEFDRESTATLILNRQKDREGWLPERLTFEVGGTDEGFVMRRDDDLAKTVNVTFLSGDERSALEILERLGEARSVIWQRATEGEMSRRTFYRVLARLKEKGKVGQEGDAYRPLDVVVPIGAKSVPGTSGTTSNSGASGVGASGATPLGVDTRAGTDPLPASSPAPDPQDKEYF